jgi:nicotinamidase/pyrazinamidase
VQDTPGAQFHPALHLGKRAHVYSKGQEPENDAGYSAFEGVRESLAGLHTLGRDLLEAGITDLIVAGLATDYCVKASVLDALRENFRVWLFTPGIRPVDVQQGDGERALALMHEAGAFLFE